jgi:hypothetical protein
MLNHRGRILPAAGMEQVLFTDRDPIHHTGIWWTGLGDGIRNQKHGLENQEFLAY